MKENGNRCFLEDWVRGAKGKGGILDGKFEDLDSKHPHITFVRPFSIPEGIEDEVKSLIINYCKGRKPIEFKLKGKGNFPGGITYIPVESEELLEFNDGLEKILEGRVIFDEKLSDKKTLHLMTTMDNFEDFPETVLPMLRLTCIRNKKIWFSCDFEAGTVLSREESLNRANWNITKALYYDRVEPGRPTTTIQDTLEALRDYDPTNDKYFEFSNMIGDFIMSARARDIEGGSEFVEEMGPKLFMYFIDYIRKHAERKVRESEKNHHETTLAFELGTAYELLQLNANESFKQEFIGLVKFVKTKQCPERQAFTDYLLYKECQNYPLKC